MTKPPRPVFIPDATTRAVIDHMAKHPDDTLSWAALADLLETAEAPTAAILVARRCGLWRGTREQWEQQGPDVVDVVPVRWVWLMDVGTTENRRPADSVMFFMRNNGSCIEGDEVPSYWAPQEEPGNWKRFDSVESAQSWLTEIALAYARRVRDGGDIEP